MSFFNNLKRAFGFNDNGDDIDDVVDYDLSRSPFANPFRRNDQPRRDLYEETPRADDEAIVEPMPRTVPQPAQEPVVEKVEKVQPAPKAVSHPVEKAEPAPAARTQSAEKAVPVVEPEVEAVVQPTVDTTPQQPGTAVVNMALIDTVVDLINAALPPAMKQYIDTEGQRHDVEKALTPHVAAIARQATPVTSDSGLKVMLKTCDMQRRAAQNRANDLSVRLTEVENDVEKLEIERKSLLNKIKVLEMKASTNEDASQLQDRMDKVSKQLEKKDAAIGELNGQLERCSTALAERDNTIESLHEQLNEANEELKIAEQLAARIDEMEQFKIRKNEEIRDLRDHMAVLERENQDTERLKAELKLASEEVISLKKELDANNRKNLEERSKHNRRDVELANHLNDLKSQVASAASLAESYKDSLDLQLKAVDELRAQLDKAKETGDDTRKQLAEARQELAAARNEMKSLAPANEELKKQLEAAGEELAVARTHVQESAEELQAAHIINDDLVQQIEELRARLAAAPTAAEESTPVTEAAVNEPEPEHVAEAETEGPEEKPVAVNPKEEPATVVLEEPTVEEPEAEVTEEPAPVAMEEPEAEAPVDHETHAEPEVVADEPKEEYGNKTLGITLDDIDDVDWLIPVEPDPIPEPEPEPEPEPAPEPKPKADPRQLSLW